MDKSLWEAKSRSPSQEIALLLRNPKARYHVHKSSQMDPYPEPDASSPIF
jgi:hypothetical protein